ncbi:MAG TPA: hypothetical protein VK783_09345 [Bacteroidia bacterium]|jgi:hypothetical protein|nr:hypothetical protein [Bacteroidia bacterium]
MKKTYFLNTLLAIAVAFILSGCSGKDGATGPAGPTGNANVSVYDVIEAPSSWVADGNGGWIAVLTATGFSPSAGACNVYMSSDNSSWTALPFVGYTLGSPDVNYVFNNAQIDIYYDAQAGTASISQPSNTYYFKVVVIPPAAMHQHPHTNWNNLDEVNAVIIQQKASR